MPSFLLLKDQELHAIVEYVRFLSMRGEYERKLTTELSADFSSKQVEQRLKDGESRDAIVQELSEFLGADMKEQAVSLGDELAEQWSAADTEETAVIPAVARIPDSIESRRNRSSRSHR